MPDNHSKTCCKNINNGNQCHHFAKTAKNMEKKELWERYFSVKAEFTDVKYAQAMTYHKLQGSSYTSVFADIRDIEILQSTYKGTEASKKEEMDLVFRLLYVGITRASENLHILRN